MRPRERRQTGKLGQSPLTRRIRKVTVRNGDWITAVPERPLQPNIRRRVSTLDFGMLLIIVGFVGAIVLVIIYGIRINAAPSDAMVNGGPVTAGAHADPRFNSVRQQARPAGRTVVEKWL